MQVFKALSSRIWYRLDIDEQQSSFIVEMIRTKLLKAQMAKDGFSQVIDAVLNEKSPSGLYPEEKVVFVDHIFKYSTLFTQTPESKILRTRL